MNLRTLLVLPLLLPLPLAAQKKATPAAKAKEVFRFELPANPILIQGDFIQRSSFKTPGYRPIELTATGPAGVDQGAWLQGHPQLRLPHPAPPLSVQFLQGYNGLNPSPGSTHHIYPEGLCHESTIPRPCLVSSSAPCSIKLKSAASQ